MCGKFTQMASWREVVAFSQPLEDLRGKGGDNDEEIVATPMRWATVIRLNDQGEREAVQMRWGFAEHRASTPAFPKHMHARSETIDTRPTFAEAFAHRRGILVVRTFNEGEEIGKKTKQWVVTPKDGQPIAIAVIYEEWRNGAETLLTFVQVTTPPNPLIARITDRMPAILQPDDWGLWLGEDRAPLAEVKAVLRTFDDDGNWEMTEQDKLRPKATAKPKAEPKGKPDAQDSLF